mgnify:CR=1 FL=1
MPAVRLLGAALRRLAGGAEIEVAGGDVAELLDALAARAGPELAALIFAPARAPEGAQDGASAGAPVGTDRSLQRDCVVLVNGRSVEFQDGLRTRVAEGDTLSLFLTGARGWPGG